MSTKIKKLLDKIYPGVILLGECIGPLGITVQKLAADIDASPGRISDIGNEKSPISADAGLRVGIFFNMDAQYWLNLQSEYDALVGKVGDNPDLPLPMDANVTYLLRS